MRFGEQHETGDTAGGTCDIGELMKVVAHNSETRKPHQTNARRLQRAAISEQIDGAAALEEVGSEVKTLHVLPPRPWGERGQNFYGLIYA